MDHKEFIESGILDLYILGSLTAEEIKEVEAMADAHPEVKAEIFRLQEEFAQNFLQNPVTPSPQVKVNLMAAIAQPKPEQKEEPKEETPTIPYDPLNRSNQKSQLKFYLVAASVLLLLSLGANFYFVNQNVELTSDLSQKEKELALVLKDNESWKTNYTSVYEAYNTLEKKFSMASSPEAAMVKMTDVKGNDQNLAVVMWDSKTKIVYVAVEALDSLPKGMQYQLWAIVDGKPVNMGVFDPMKKYEYREMKAIESASAFAVTMEEAGGSAEPHMDQMLVMGNV